MYADTRILFLVVTQAARYRQECGAKLSRDKTRLAPYVIGRRAFVIVFVYQKDRRVFPADLRPLTQLPLTEWLLGSSCRSPRQQHFYLAINP